MRISEYHGNLSVIGPIWWSFFGKRIVAAVMVCPLFSDIEDDMQDVIFA